MSLEKRVIQLEQRLGSSDNFVLFVVSALGCDPTKMGTDRVIEREVTGYSASGRSREWKREPGETAVALKERVEKDVRAEGHKVYVVCESYAVPPTAG